MAEATMNLNITNIQTYRVWQLVAVSLVLPWTKSGVACPNWWIFLQNTESPPLFSYVVMNEGEFFLPKAEFDQYVLYGFNYSSRSQRFPLCTLYCCELLFCPGYCLQSNGALRRVEI